MENFELNSQDFGRPCKFKRHIGCEILDGKVTEIFSKDEEAGTFKFWNVSEKGTAETTNGEVVFVHINELVFADK